MVRICNARIRMARKSPSSRAGTRSTSRTAKPFSRPRCARDSTCPTAAATARAAPARASCVAGQVDYGVYQHKALTEDERAAGNALFCQAKPLTRPRRSRARTIGAAKDIQVKTLPCRVQKMERVTDDVMVLQLKLPANERLQFLAGQYIEFLLKDGAAAQLLDGQRAARRRAAAAARAPRRRRPVHRPRLQQDEGARHPALRGPLGTFFLREDRAKPIVFVASGTGFAPIKAIIEHGVHRGRRAADDALLGRAAAARTSTWTRSRGSGRPSSAASSTCR